MTEQTKQSDQAEQKNEAKREKVRVVPLQYVDDFPDHPFQVKDDEGTSFDTVVGSFPIRSPIFLNVIPLFRHS